MATNLISAGGRQLRGGSATIRDGGIVGNAQQDLIRARDNYNRQLTINNGFGTTQNAQDNLRNAQFNLGNVNRIANVRAAVPQYGDNLGDTYQKTTLDVLGPGYAEQESLRTETQGLFGQGQQDLERTRKAVREGILANQAAAEGIQAGVGTRAGFSNSAIGAAKQLATTETTKELAGAEADYLANRRNAEQQYLANLAAINAANQNIDQARQGANSTVYGQLSYAQQAALNRQQQAAQQAAALQYYRDQMSNINRGQNRDNATFLLNAPYNNNSRQIQATDNFMYAGY